MKNFRLITAVWGEVYIDTFLNCTLRSLLAEYNIPYLANQEKIKYDIYTDLNSIKTLKDSNIFNLLIKYLEIKFYDISNLNKNDRYSLHWKCWNNSIRNAKKQNDVVIFIIPDIVYAHDCLKAWHHQLKIGNKCIFTIGSWVVEESFEEEFYSLYPKNRFDTVSITRFNIQKFICDHLHPLIGATFYESKYKSHHLDRVSIGLGNNNFCSSVISSQPFVFDPNYFIMNSNQCPENNFDKIYFDETCTLSIAPLLHLHEWYQEPINCVLENISYNWLKDNMSEVHNYESSFQYNYNNNTKKDKKLNEIIELIKIKKAIINSGIIDIARNHGLKITHSLIINFINNDAFIKKLLLSDIKNKKYVFLLPTDIFYTKVNYFDNIFEFDFNFLNSFITDLVNFELNEQVFLEFHIDDFYTFTNAKICSGAIPFKYGVAYLIS